MSWRALPPRRPAGCAGRVLEIGATPWGFFVTAERCRGGYLDDLDGDQLRGVLPDLLRVLAVVAELTPPGPGYGGWDAAGHAPWPAWREALLSVRDEHPRTAGWADRLATRPGPATVFRRGVDALADMLRQLERRWPDGAPRRIVRTVRTGRAYPPGFSVFSVFSA